MNTHLAMVSHECSFCQHWQVLRVLVPRNSSHWASPHLFFVTLPGTSLHIGRAKQHLSHQNLTLIITFPGSNVVSNLRHFLNLAIHSLIDTQRALSKFQDAGRLHWEPRDTKIKKTWPTILGLSLKFLFLGTYLYFWLDPAAHHIPHLIGGYLSLPLSCLAFCLSSSVVEILQGPHSDTSSSKPSWLTPPEAGV